MLQVQAGREMSTEHPMGWGVPIEGLLRMTGRLHNHLEVSLVCWGLEFPPSAPEVRIGFSSERRSPLAPMAPAGRT